MERIYIWKIRSKQCKEYVKNGYKQHGKILERYVGNSRKGCEKYS